jgi:hypothetical protein
MKFPIQALSLTLALLAIGATAHAADFSDYDPLVKGAGAAVGAAAGCPLGLVAGIGVSAVADAATKGRISAQATDRIFISSCAAGAVGGGFAGAAITGSMLEEAPATNDLQQPEANNAD